MKKLSFLSIFSVGYLEISFSYRPRIVLVSSSYRSPIVLASGSGNNTETIRSRYTLEGRTI